MTGAAPGGEQRFQSFGQTLRLGFGKREDAKLLGDGRRFVQQGEQLGDQDMIVARRAADQRVGAFFGFDGEGRIHAASAALGSLVEHLLQLGGQLDGAAELQGIDLERQDVRAGLTIHSPDQILHPSQGVARAGDDQRVAALIGDDRRQIDQIRLRSVLLHAGE